MNIIPLNLIRKDHSSYDYEATRSQMVGRTIMSIVEDESRLFIFFTDGTYTTYRAYDTDEGTRIDFFGAAYDEKELLHAAAIGGIISGEEYQSEINKIIDAEEEKSRASREEYQRKQYEELKKKFENI